MEVRPQQLPSVTIDQLVEKRNAAQEYLDQTPIEIVTDKAFKRLQNQQPESPEDLYRFRQDNQDKIDEIAAKIEADTITPAKATRHIFENIFQVPLESSDTGIKADIWAKISDQDRNQVKDLHRPDKDIDRGEKPLQLHLSVDGQKVYASLIPLFPDSRGLVFDAVFLCQDEHNNWTYWGGNHDYNLGELVGNLINAAKNPITPVTEQ